MRNPLLVNALELLRRPGSSKDIELQVGQAVVGIQDARLIPGSEIEISVHCQSLSDAIVVNGRVRAQFGSECRRCLIPVGGNVDIEVRELYQTTVTDPDAFPILNDQIDLLPLVRETLLLELPAAPVCRPDCAGLCPVCGVDRNTASCQCTSAEFDPRWAVLDSLRKQLPE